MIYNDIVTTYISFKQQSYAQSYGFTGSLRVSTQQFARY